MKDSKGRTLVGKPTITKANARKIDSSRILIEDARSIIGNELEKISAQSFGSGMALGPDETRALHGHVKALETLLKTEIEDSKTTSAELEGMDMEALALEALRALQLQDPTRSPQELMDLLAAKLRQPQLK